MFAVRAILSTSFRVSLKERRNLMTWNVLFVDFFVQWKPFFYPLRYANGMIHEENDLVVFSILQLSVFRAFSIVQGSIIPVFCLSCVFSVFLYSIFQSFNLISNLLFLDF